MSSKRYKVLPQDTRKLKADTFENLLQVIKKNSTAKFDESIDINFQLNLNLCFSINSLIKLLVVTKQ